MKASPISLGFCGDSWVIMSVTVVQTSTNIDGSFGTAMQCPSPTSSPVSTAFMATPWLIAGDFHVVVSGEDKKGGNRGCDGNLRDFNDVVVQAAVSNAGFRGNSFTWSNNQHGDRRVFGFFESSINIIFFQIHLYLHLLSEVARPYSGLLPLRERGHRDRQEDRPPFSFALHRLHGLLLQGFLPTTYLGCPLFNGRVKIDMFEEIFSKISAGLAYSVSVGDVVVIIVHSTEARFLMAESCALNRSAPLQDLLLVISKASALASLFGLPLSLAQVQWDRDLGSSESSKWTAFSCNISAKIVARSTNVPARVLARSCFDSPAFSSARLRLSDLPTASSYLALLQDVAGSQPSSLMPSRPFFSFEFFPLKVLNC
uniref:Uncharacterized protein n=1 Tax=Kalanchoe fedtschenkoi TaxID=63787 RepID=A0A7N0TMZ5_KALFE